MSEPTPRRVYCDEDIEPRDIVRVTRLQDGVHTVTTFTYAGWDPSLLDDVAVGGGRIPRVNFVDDLVEVIGRKEKEWPKGGTPILVTETHDPLGEAGLPKTPFVAIVTGGNFTASREGSWIHDWNGSFAAEWRELTARKPPFGDYRKPPFGDYVVEVRSE